ncbi:MAG: GerMN domain-containing protein [Candidatus Ornithospirochaeta sp.]|nr:GerMN domain-containing protein [Candidatus Ornithospirochaeta sp.]
MAGSKKQYILDSLLLALLVLIASGAVVLASAKANDTIERYRIEEHWNMFSEEIAGEKDSAFSALYIGSVLVFKPRTAPKTSPDPYFTLNTLFIPLSKEEKEEGYATYIPKGTRLLGVTMQDRFAAIDISDRILSSSDIDKAIYQIKRTMNHEFGTTGFIILINGIEFSE